jgi:hypothetical protein
MRLHITLSTVHGAISRDRCRLVVKQEAGLDANLRSAPNLSRQYLLRNPL